MQITKKLISNNFTGGRRNYPIKKIVLHTYDGIGTSLFNWFNKTTTKASAHYSVWKNGTVEQYVEDYNTAWHAGSGEVTVNGIKVPNFNLVSIGIEHQDDKNPNDSVRTPELYEASAQLVAHLCRSYNIPCTRDNIIRHREVPGVKKSCPGGLDIDKIIARANEILFPPIEDPKMIAELQQQITGLQNQLATLQTQLSVKDTLIADLTKERDFIKLEDQEYRKSSAEEFFKYKEEVDAKYNALKTNYDGLITRIGQSDNNDKLEAQVEGLRLQLAAAKKEIETLSAKLAESTKEEPEVIPQVQTIKLSELVDKDKKASGALEFAKTHSGLMFKGSAYGSIGLVIVDLATQVLNLDIPQVWSVEGVMAFISSGVLVAYGFWIRNHDKIQPLLVRKEQKADEQAGG